MAANSGMPQIGLQAILDDKDFQAGLARYVAGQQQAQRVGEQAAKAIGVSWDEASQRFKDASNKFVSTQDVVQRLNDLKQKFEDVKPPADKAGSGVSNFATTAKGAIDIVLNSAGALVRGLEEIIATAAKVTLAIGAIGTAGLAAFVAGATEAINSARAWGGELHDLQDIFGMSDRGAAGFATAMHLVGLSVDEGSSGFSYFVRQTDATRVALANAQNTFKETAETIRETFVQAQEQAAENIQGIWADLAEKRQTIEEDLASKIEDINASLAEKLSQIADERTKVTQKLTKDLAKLDSETHDRLIDTHDAKERRRIKKEAAQRRQELIDAANERQAELAKQEQREKDQAARQIALAERVAQKQIDAAEKAANKQIEAQEKMLKKAEEAQDKALAKAEKAMAKQESATPMLKALDKLGISWKYISDESIPFEQRMNTIAAAFAKMPDGVQKTDIALQLFGRGGLVFLDFLNRLGKDGIKSFEDLAQSMGLVFDPAQVKQFNRDLNLIQFQFEGLGTAIGIKLLPYAQRFLTWAGQMVREAMPKVIALIDRLSKSFEKGGFKGLIDEIMKVIGEAFSDKGNQKLVSDAATNLSNALGAALHLVIQGAQWIGDVVGGIITKVSEWAATPEGQKAINDAMQKTGDALGTALTLFFNTTKKVSDAMLALSAQMLAWVNSPEGHKAISDLTTATTTAIIDGLKNMLGDHKNGDNVIQSLISNLFWAGRNAINSIAAIGADVASTIIGGIVEFFLGREAGDRVREALKGGLTTAFSALMNPGGFLAEQAANLANSFYTNFTNVLQTLFNNFSIPGITGGASNQQPAPVGVGVFQNGGWVPRTGWGHLDQGEYVLNRRQVQSLAPILNNQRTQVLNFNHTWNAPVSRDDQAAIKRMVRSETLDVISQVLPRSG